MARRSTPFDRGTDFKEWAYLQNGIGSKTWFCDQSTFSDRDLAFICNQLNSTPRKGLGYKHLR